MTFHKLVRDLELPEGVDLPLRIAPQQRIGALHDVVGSEIAQERAEDVCAIGRAAGHGGGEGGADLAVQVLPLRLEALERGDLRAGSAA